MTTADQWDDMSDDERFAVLDEIEDISLLQACKFVEQPFHRLRSDVQDKITEAMKGKL